MLTNMLHRSVMVHRWTQVVSLWLWLANRFPEHVFPERARVEEEEARLLRLMHEGLTSMTFADARPAPKQRAGPSQVFPLTVVPLL